MNSVAQTLFQLYCRNRLAPFYIIRPPVIGHINQSEDTLQKVYKDFSNLVLTHHKFTDPAHTVSVGHSDILFIEKEDKLKDYKQDDPEIQQFFNAQKFGPLDLNKKFIWINQAHHISKSFLNKWLKTLEEPNNAITTFFLVPHQTPLIQTIESRAITMKVADTLTSKRPKTPYSSFSKFLENSENSKDLYEALTPYLKDRNQVHLALDILKKKPELHASLLESFQDFWSHSSAEPRQLQRALEEIQWHGQSKTYNNLATERIYGLLSCLKEYI